MAQSTDITLANQSGLAFRTELNSILAALSSLQSGSSAPSTTNAYQLWVERAFSQVSKKSVGKIRFEELKRADVD